MSTKVFKSRSHLYSESYSKGYKESSHEQAKLCVNGLTASITCKLKANSLEFVTAGKLWCI